MGAPPPLLEVALAAARSAATVLRDGELDRDRIATKSSATDLVTDLDRAAESRIVEVITAARPTDGILGEEGGERPGTSGVRWVVDPLDGTTNFVYGFPAYAVSVAAEVAGATPVAVVLDASRAEEFTASPEQGARCNGEPIAPSATVDLAAALVGTGFAYDAGERRRQAAVLPAVLPRVRDLRRAGAAALDLCWVACGRLDAFWEQGLAPWDRAGGEAVCSAAGARVGRLGRGTPSTALAATPALYEGVEALLLEAGAGA